mmetsp:Transcript_1317/g.2798  ORF Transcript_1317/g.2798 Transcript_1317/m.2798 type:complete len:119 (+) Transcript_1317:1651-2007(+)
MFLHDCISPKFHSSTSILLPFLLTTSGPAVANSRYVLEDVPYGLVLTVILGKLVKRPAVLHESGIRIISAMYGRDFITENNLLEGLGLIDNGERKVDSELLFNLDIWREMAYSGYFKD